MTDWFTSDTHFGHAKVIVYSKRPFGSVREMDEALIANWNERVKVTDTIYHLGDFGFGRKGELQQILDQLNGHKHLIEGNHDRKARIHTLRGWASVQHYREINIDGQHIVLFHYAQRVWNRSHHVSIALFGHSHGHMPGNSQSLDVGTDCWSYRPVNLVEIREKLSRLPKFIGYRDQASKHSELVPVESWERDEDGHTRMIEGYQLED